MNKQFPNKNGFCIHTPFMHAHAHSDRDHIKRIKKSHLNKLLCSLLLNQRGHRKGGKYEHTHTHDSTKHLHIQAHTNTIHIRSVITSDVDSFLKEHIQQLLASLFLSIKPFCYDKIE